jgi:hypothetical protein
MAVQMRVGNTRLKVQTITVKLARDYELMITTYMELSVRYREQLLLAGKSLSVHCNISSASGNMAAFPSV